MERETHDDGGAWFDESGTYRYLLWRRLRQTRPGRPCRSVLWILLNPSSADATRNDPTIRRVLAFSRRWREVARLEVVNLFAYRCADPAELARADEPVGPRTDAVLAEALARASRVIVGWGASPLAGVRAECVARRVHAAGHDPTCLGHTASGAPRHPLYLPRGCRLRRWRGPMGARPVSAP